MIRELSAFMVFIRLVRFSKNHLIVLSGTENRHQPIIKDNIQFQQHFHMPAVEFVDGPQNFSQFVNDP